MCTGRDQAQVVFINPSQQFQIDLFTARSERSETQLYSVQVVAVCAERNLTKLNSLLCHAHVSTFLHMLHDGKFRRQLNAVFVPALTQFLTSCRLTSIKFISI